MRKAGDFRAAEALYRQGYLEAVRRNDRLAAVRFLISVGGCELHALRYRAALAAFLEARQTGVAIADHADLGAIAVNLSSLYLQMWDLPSAMRSAEDGLEQSEFVAGNPAQSYFKPHLLVQLGRIHAVLHDGRARAFFSAGIEAARARGDIVIEAMAWDLLGQESLTAEHLPEAEKAFLEAYRLRRLLASGELGLSYSYLGALALARNDLPAAGRLTQLALDASRRGAPAWTEHLLLHQQGQIRLALGQTNAALLDFSRALDATAEWRVQVLPARSPMVNSNAALEEQIFQSFIQLAAARAFQNGNPEWTARALEAVELNRAASLRETLALADVWREKLPLEYWETLAQLSAEEALASPTLLSNSSASRLRLKLTEMEAEAGIGLRQKKSENNRGRNSLTHFQDGLRDSELLLSFELGERESYLWAVSRTSVRLYRLPAKREIASSVQKFRDAFPAGGAEAIRRGEQLYRQLFGQLGPLEASKPAWLLSLDGELFDVPFAALVTEQRGNTAVYLMEHHSLQTVPGALLLNASPDPAGWSKRSRGEFLGVGDPIYNQVDPRWRGAVSGNPAGSQMQRLVGSGDEVRSSAGTWTKGGGTAVLLEGRRASRDAFLRALQTRPAVIHLATHVIFRATNQEQGLIAFGLGSASARSSRGNAEPEFLTTSEIAGLRVPGALVVMTGCATGSGEVRAGAGLLGLTRAWLMAGASAVISTAWPVEDTSGGMFARFYYYLQNHSAAEALQLSQREVAHSGAGRQAPATWASYQVTGGIH